MGVHTKRVVTVRAAVAVALIIAAVACEAPTRPVISGHGHSLHNSNAGNIFFGAWSWPAPSDWLARTSPLLAQPYNRLDALLFREHWNQITTDATIGTFAASNPVRRYILVDD